MTVHLETWGPQSLFWSGARRAKPRQHVSFKGNCPLTNTWGGHNTRHPISSSPPPSSRAREKETICVPTENDRLC